jgi:hypothetical protein
VRERAQRAAPAQCSCSGGILSVVLLAALEAAHGRLCRMADKKAFVLPKQKKSPFQVCGVRLSPCAQVALHRCCGAALSA